MSATTDPRCPECGDPIRRSAPRGLCSRCLVTNALFVDAPQAGQTLPEPSLEALNAALTDFEVRRIIGRGGMGVVYEAWQKSLARSVALKLLSAELLRSEEFFERFNREARLMAQMDHANVARVFGSGITDQGEAYIAMELIRGEPIMAYVTARRLNLRQRLDLFVQVCAGVQHAHQKGIIHRDLKPSNILVADIEGRVVPKVIDFGLAKPIGQTAGDESVWLSARHAVGTPAYMSPEQASGGDIDSRSDVYSLGALLYELLVGKPPFDDSSLHGASRSVIEQALRHTPVPRPSDAAGAGASLQANAGHGAAASAQPAGEWAPAKPSELRGDLDAIVLKALAKDPARRYQTVAALPEDIERHLTHQPVAAFDPSGAYVLWKFCRRHRVSLAIVAGISLLLLTGIGLVLRESVRTRRAERLAEERLQQGERLIEFMLGNLRDQLQALGRLDVLEVVVAEIERFYGQPSTNLPAESLRNRGRAMLQLGWIQNAQGKSGAAKADYQESIRLYASAIARRPGRMQWQKELGESWNSLAIFHHSRAEWEAAEEAYREAISLVDRLLETNPDQGDWADFKASLLHNFGALCEALGRLDEAESKFTQALRVWEGLHAKAPDNAGLLEHMSHLYANLAFLQGRRGDLAGVFESNAEALRLRERLVQLTTNGVHAMSLLADIQQNISELHLNQGNLDQAEEWMRRYRPVREQLASRDPGNAGWQYLLADAWRNFAVLQTRRDNLDAAAHAHRTAWTISEKFGRTPISPGSPGERWLNGLRGADEVFARLAQLEQEQGNLAAAEQHRQVLAEIRAKIANAGATTNSFAP